MMEYENETCRESVFIPSASRNRCKKFGLKDRFVLVIFDVRKKIGVVRFHCRCRESDLVQEADSSWPSVAKVLESSLGSVRVILDELLNP